MRSGRAIADTGEADSAASRVVSTGEREEPSPQRVKSKRLESLARVNTLISRVLKRDAASRPGHIAAYRGFSDSSGAELMGRVLASPPPGVPDTHGNRWRNLREQWARFVSEGISGVSLEISCNGLTQRTVTDAEGYYRVRVPMAPPDHRSLWRRAEVRIPGSELSACHEILAVSEEASFGIISDIDDTVLDSQIVDWKSTAKLTFLHNVRTRKPLPGVAQLYLSLQKGHADVPVNPLFYVSSSPWNLYDLLETFLVLNGIPPGPMLLRHFAFGPEFFRGSGGHAQKLENVRTLFSRYPDMKWVLVGDSGQADAQIYAQATREFPDRVLAIYIRDVDPETHSVFDHGVDKIMSTVSGTPMLRVRDSDAIAEHARSIGLLPALQVAIVEAEVTRDEASPPQVDPPSS